MIYIGNFSGRGAHGIGVADWRDGVLAFVTTVDCPDNPSYLALAPDGRTLYAAHELSDGLVSAFGVDAGGRLHMLGDQPSGGAEPCHLSVHPSGRYLLCAHWGSGSIALHPIEPDGSLGPVSDVVANPNREAHMVVTDRAGRWVLAVHLGANTVYTFGIDLESGRLRLGSEMHLCHGAGPRHIAFNARCTTAYVVNELDSSVTACGYDPLAGRLEPGETVRTVARHVRGDNNPSAILVSADGRFVYVGNRGDDNVALLTTEPRLRLLATYPCGGWSKDMALADGGRVLLVANEHEDRVTVLAVDPVDGSLRATGSTLGTPNPTCVLPV